MPSGKSLTEDENEKLKVIVAQLKEEYGTQQALARALGEGSQQMISQFLAPHGKAGVSFAIKVAKLRGFRTYTDMFDPNIKTYGENQSWIDNEPEARKLLPMPEAAYRLARETPAYIGRPNYTPSLIADTVKWRWQMASDEEKTRAEERQIKSEMDSDGKNVTKLHARTPKVPPSSPSSRRRSGS